MKHNNSTYLSKDPVCGAVISRVTATASCRYKGRIFLFCSKQCRDKFSKKPRHYLVRRRGRKLPPRMKLPINGMKGFRPYSVRVAGIH